MVPGQNSTVANPFVLLGHETDLLPTRGSSLLSGEDKLLFSHVIIINLEQQLGLLAPHSPIFAGIDGIFMIFNPNNLRAFAKLRIYDIRMCKVVFYYPARWDGAERIAGMISPLGSVYNRLLALSAWVGTTVARMAFGRNHTKDVGFFFLRHELLIFFSYL